MVNLKDFIIQSKLFKCIELPDLLLVDYQCYVKEVVSDIWCHESYIAHVIGGEKMWKTSTSEEVVGSGESIFVRKGATTVHQYFQEPFLVLFIFFGKKMVDNIFDTKLGNAFSRYRDHQKKDLMRLPQHPVLHGYFRSLLSYLSNAENIDPVLIRHKVEEVLIFLSTMTSFRPVAAQLLDSVRSHSIRPVMESQYHLPLKVADFARLTSRSVSTFRRDFQQEFGMPPSKWLLKKRLDLSKLLIHSQNDSIEIIAEKSGFANRSHFSKVFKERFGMSPSQLR